ncbi:protein kinase domain-containing protein [Halomicronema hongdechloris]|uniref:protein kinase domain-containing protein n=1 Tax=Halomicronema hongdechloris TaxID=1209493 RepID=UPI0009D1B00C|nr:hypothetical protein [Halomicronema hongdechloris]
MQDKSATYLAVDVTTDTVVVLKQLQPSSLSLLGPDSPRLETLFSLKHPGIAAYKAICRKGEYTYLVRAYIDARSLASRRSFRPEEIKAVAISLLEVLADFQVQIPMIIHGNIKPENIFFRPLSNGKLSLILTDFDLAVSHRYPSSFEPARAGTLGFTPREQMLGEPRPASDNYAVGAVLLSLLSGTPTHQMDTLTDADNPYRYRSQDILWQPHTTISSQFLSWLDRMLDPNPDHRFPDARTALQALLPLRLIARARASLSHSQIRLEAPTLGAQLQDVIRVSNLRPDAVLQGQWHITPRPYDPCDWIDIHPTYLAGNETTTVVSVDTRRLQAKTTYVRELILQSNSEQPIIAVSLCITTADLTLPSRPLPLWHLIGLLVSSTFLPVTMVILLRALNKG